MKLTMPRDVLAAVTGWVAATARPARNPLSPVLAGIMLTATADGTLTVAGSDGQISATARADAEVGEPGRVLVPARMLPAVLAALPARQPADVTSDGTRVILTAAGVRYTLPALPDDAYPDPAEPGAHAAGFDARTLAATIARTVTAAGKDDTLPALTCVRLTLDGKQTATLTATDRYRLTIATCPYAAGPANAQTTAMIPARALAVLARLPGGTWPVQLAVTGETATFSYDRRHVTMRLISGEFPDVTRHLPGPGAITTAVTADAAPLAAALKRAAIVARRGDPVRLAFAGSTVTVESGTSGDATCTETLPAALDGEPLRIAFNPGYLLDGLAAAASTGSTAIRIAMTTSGKPAVITPAAPGADPAVTYVLMPVKSAG